MLTKNRMLATLALSLIALTAACAGDEPIEDTGSEESAASGGRFGYAVIGDSFTAGTGATAVDAENPFTSSEPYRHHMGYAQQYRGALRTVNKSIGLDYHNRAVFGATSAEPIFTKSRSSVTCMLCATASASWKPWSRPARK